MVGRLLQRRASARAPPSSSSSPFWFAPLLRALKRRQLSALTLVAEDGGAAAGFELSAADLWKFWRRAQLPAQ